MDAVEASITCLPNPLQVLQQSSLLLIPLRYYFCMWWPPKPDVHLPEDFLWNPDISPVKCRGVSAPREAFSWYWWRWLIPPDWLGDLTLVVPWRSRSRCSQNWPTWQYSSPSCVPCLVPFLFPPYFLRVTLC
jgi:hypothetical protein